MHTILRTLRTQWLGAIGILIGVTGVAFGATGQPALLGKLNQADRSTIIENTGNGPAVTFKTKATKPPFNVTSSQQVPNLNASKLGGSPPSAFALSGSSYTKTESDGRYVSKSGFPAYTKTESDAKYAPAAGSPSYVVAGTQTLIAKDAIGSASTPTHEVFFGPVIAPGDGLITLTVSGYCSGATGALEAQAGDGAPNDSQPIAGSGIVCTVSSSRSVSAGDGPHMQVNLTNAGGGATTFAGTIVVTFTPAAP